MIDVFVFSSVPRDECHGEDLNEVQTVPAESLRTFHSPSVVSSTIQSETGLQIVQQNKTLIQHRQAQNLSLVTILNQISLLPTLKTYLHKVCLMWYRGLSSGRLLTGSPACLLYVLHVSLITYTCPPHRISLSQQYHVTCCTSACYVMSQFLWCSGKDVMVQG